MPPEWGGFPPDSPQSTGDHGPEKALGGLNSPAATRAPEVEVRTSLPHHFKSMVSLCLGEWAKDEAIKEYLELWCVAGAANKGAVAARAARSTPIDLVGSKRDARELPLSQTAGNSEGFLPLKTGGMRRSSDWWDPLQD